GLAILIFAILRGGDQTGSPVALCPGPDAFGYTCDDGAFFEYIEATQDTGLYTDDGLVELELPFSFSFYGHLYHRVKASSNGNLQFHTDNSAYTNECLSEGPSAGMGDMIAPYWDDLDSTSLGFLETEIVGEAPQRIFVIAWDDIPSFSSSEDRITFEVQLFEGSNDIVFLYEDATRLLGNRGSSATIGLQSESLGYALEYGCDKFSIDDESVIHFPNPNDSGSSVVGQSFEPEASGEEEFRLPAKGELEVLLRTLNNRGSNGLTAYRVTLLNQLPASDGQWLWADVTGDGRNELLFLWVKPVQKSERSHLAIIRIDDDDRPHLLWDGWPLARRSLTGVLRLRLAPDLNGDGTAEIIIEISGGNVLLITAEDGAHFKVQSVPGQCQGDISIFDIDADGVLEMVRDDCGKNHRLVTDWVSGVYRTK
ncbi:MAG: hypothetical protein JRJ87_27720, partial [Deltaproteobacteria bacterium]|nr:hypothetical protein [Deltaproteobacteria bacterium]